MVSTRKVIYGIIGVVEIILFTIFIVFGMYLELVIIITIMCFSLLIAGIIEFKPKGSASPEISQASETVSYEETEGLPANKIRCPKCNKAIPEGLTFCPECGARIPPEGLFSS
ncbi:MAG: zinc ribbon domain-containing protein [Promethearchaeota archaeon]|nr:MAG: zinc ribbon domain-containing protein [Candidatus Lokiarchaeota archaeon]